MTQRVLQFLVIDDDQDVCNATAQILESNGFKVTCAFKAEDALQMLRGKTCAPDCLVVDLLMPGSNGFSLVKEIRAMPSPWRHLPVIVSSGVIDTRVTQAATSLGISGFLVKPWRAEELFETIEAAVPPEIGIDQIRNFLGSARLADQTMLQNPVLKHINPHDAKAYPITHHDRQFCVIVSGDQPMELVKGGDDALVKKVQVYSKRPGAQNSWAYAWPTLRHLS